MLSSQTWLVLFNVIWKYSAGEKLLLYDKKTVNNQI